MGIVTGVVLFVRAILVSRATLAAENLALRHQLGALERVFTHRIAEPLTQELLQERVQPGQQVVVAHGDAGFVFESA